MDVVRKTQQQLQRHPESQSEKLAQTVFLFAAPTGMAAGQFHDVNG
jgi:hypothetical protein